MTMAKYLLLISSLFVFSTTSFAADRLNIFVSILPQQYFVEQVGQEHVDVEVMVGPGHNPATYEPTPQQMAKLAEADMYFSIGVPFESAWLDKIKRNNDQLVVIECCHEIAMVNEHNHSHDHGHHHNESGNNYDPHVWTSPLNAIYITKLIKQSLIKVDSGNTGVYQSTANALIDRLNALDNDIKTKTADLGKNELVLAHPSWFYFAERYGLKQIPIEQGGKEIQANAMVKLIQHAKKNNIKAVFVQPQFSRRAAEVIAKEIDGKILELDPLAYDYIENMTDVSDKIVQGLSDG